jgi:hypothetical protein
MVAKSGDRPGQAVLVPARVSLRTEKDGALIVIDAMDREAPGTEKEAHFGANQPG